MCLAALAASAPEARAQTPESRPASRATAASRPRPRRAVPTDPSFAAVADALQVLAGRFTDATPETAAAAERLERRRTADGGFADARIARSGLAQACATAAACDAYARDRTAERRAVADRALARLAALRRADGSWTLPSSDRGDDAVVTGWALLAMELGRGAGLRVDENARAGARAWIRRAADYEEDSKPPPATPRAARPAAVCAAIEAMLGTPTDDVRQRALLDALETVDPFAGGAIDGGDAQFWFFATTAMARAGGPSWDHWAPILHRRLDRQVKAGPDKGTWSPVAGWDLIGGRAYVSRMAAFDYAAYYRYPGALASTGTPSKY